MIKKIKLFVIDETGTMKDMVWVIGAAVITGVVLFAILALAPGTAETLWNDMVAWLRNNLGI